MKQLRYKDVNIGDCITSKDSLEPKYLVYKKIEKLSKSLVILFLKGHPRFIYVYSNELKEYKKL